MRKYGALYNAKTGKFSVIAKDFSDDHYYMHMQDIGDETEVNEVVRALNAYQRQLERQ